MQYSDTTNKNGLLQRYEDYTGLGDGVVTGDATLKAKATAHINETVHELTVDLMLLQDDFDWDDPYKTDYPIATTNLIAGQRDYQFDSISFLKLKRVDISWDGSTYYRATPFDSTTLIDGLGNDTDVDALFDRTEPRYDPKAFGFWLYPLATTTDVANGAKARIEFARSFTEYTTSDTTKEPPIDRPFHDLIAIGAALRWGKLSPKRYTQLLTQYGERVPNGRGGYTYTGGRAAMVAHYSSRNEDAALYVDLSGLPSYS